MKKTETMGSLWPTAPAIEINQSGQGVPVPRYDVLYAGERLGVFSEGREALEMAVRIGGKIIAVVEDTARQVFPVPSHEEE